jgi:hypothetical protein
LKSIYQQQQHQQQHQQQQHQQQHQYTKCIVVVLFSADDLGEG